MLPQNISRANSLVYNVCSADIALKDSEQVEDSKLDNEVFLLPE